MSGSRTRPAAGRRPRAVVRGRLGDGWSGRIAVAVAVAGILAGLALLGRTVPLVAIGVLVLSDKSVLLGWAALVTTLTAIGMTTVAAARDRDGPLAVGFVLLLVGITLLAVTLFSSAASPAARERALYRSVTVTEHRHPAVPDARPGGALAAQRALAVAATARWGHGATVARPVWIARTGAWCSQVVVAHIVVGVACRPHPAAAGRVQTVALPAAMRYRLTLGAARWWHADDPQLTLARQVPGARLARDPGYGYLAHGRPVLVRYVLEPRGGLIPADVPAGVVRITATARTYLPRPDPATAWGPTVSPHDAARIARVVLAHRRAPGSPHLTLTERLGGFTLARHADGSLWWQSPVRPAAGPATRLIEVAAAPSGPTARRVPVRLTTLAVPVPSPQAAGDAAVQTVAHARLWVLREAELAPDRAWRLLVDVDGRLRVVTVDRQLQPCTPAPMGCAARDALVDATTLHTASPEQLAALGSTLAAELARRAG